MDFTDLALVPPLLRALDEEGYLRPTPIQTLAIPPALAGRDVLGCAQTGTGKTAAFALPILQRLAAAPAPPSGRRPIRALVLSPTRELAAQIDASFTAYGRHLGLRSTVIFGGVKQRPQTAQLESGVDVLVATPGRLLDLQGQGFVRFTELQVLVLDEADRMLDMGFIHDVRKIIATLPRVRQTMLFSATMPPDIQALADSILRDPVEVAADPPATTVELVEQAVYFVEKAAKRDLLVHLLGDRAIQRVLVFTRTKHGANRVVTHLQRRGVDAAAIHGNKSQGARERALEGFKRGQVRVLVATDIAARGIDVEQISHVVNFDVPNIPETYVHRIGRTARAGASGVALSFCQEDERPFLVDIQRLIGQHLPVVEAHPHRSPLGTPPPVDLRPTSRRQQAPPPQAAPAERSRRARSGRGRRSGRAGGAPGASRSAEPPRDHPASRPASRPALRPAPASPPTPAPAGGGPKRPRRRRRRKSPPAP